MTYGWRPTAANFYPRPPRGGRQFPHCLRPQLYPISIHALREEGDSGRTFFRLHRLRFLSTPSARRATYSRSGPTSGREFLSTPSARRATGADQRHQRQHCISIHALREEGDIFSILSALLRMSFLSTPSARRATDKTNKIRYISVFLSTPSARRATSATSLCTVTRYFYPRPPRGGRPQIVFMTGFCYSISIHALREEGDASTSSMTATTRSISIHALREEGDGPCPPQVQKMRHFYPRPPRGGRPAQLQSCRSSHGFLSTPSARRATSSGTPTKGDTYISIHALREEGDQGRHHDNHGQQISIHALREEGDFSLVRKLVKGAEFLSTPSARRATVKRSHLPGAGDNFYPRPPRGGRPFS